MSSGEYLGKMAAAFQLWCLSTNPSSEQVALWWTLLSMSDFGDNQDWFTVSNSTLRTCAGMTDRSLAIARECLVASGWIGYQRGHGRQGPLYRILEPQFRGVQTSIQTGNNLEPQFRGVQTSIQTSVENLEPQFRGVQTSIQTSVENLEPQFRGVQTAVQNESGVSSSKLKDLKDLKDHDHDQEAGNDDLNQGVEFLREQIAFCYQDLYNMKPTEAQMRECLEAVTVHGAEWQLVHWCLYQASLREKPSHYGLKVLKNMLQQGAKTREDAQAIADSYVATISGQDKPGQNEAKDERYKAFYDLYPDG